MSENQPKKKRFWSRRRLAYLALGCAFLFFSRNVIVHFVLERIGSSLLENEVEIGSVHVGWGNLEIVDVRIQEPANPRQPQLLVPRIQLQFAAIEDLTDGIYLEKLSVESPELHVRFDAQGKLVSQFPSLIQPTDDDKRDGLPFRRVVISGAQLVVHQAGKPSLTIGSNQLAIDASERIVIEGSLDKFLGGSAELRSEIDARSYAGRTILSCQNVDLDTATFADWPLVPASIHDSRISGTGFLNLEVQHPPDEPDPRRHLVDVTARVQQLSVRSMGGLPKRLDVVAKLRDGNVSATLELSDFEGTVSVTATTDLMEFPLTVDVVADGTEIEMRPLVAAATQAIGPLRSMDAVGAFSLTTQFVITASEIEFECSASTRVSQITAESLTLNDLHSRSLIKGSYCLNSVNPLNGHACSRVDWDGVHLDQLAPVLETEDASGTIRGTCQIDLPLDRLTDVTGLQMSGQLDFSNVSCRGLSMSDGSLRSELEQGQLAIELSSTTIRDSITRRLATLDGLLTASLTEAGQVVVRLNGREFNSQSIARLLGRPDDGFDGDLSASLVAVAPWQQAANPAKWNADAHLSCRNLEIAHEHLSDFDASLFLRQGVVQVPEFFVQWRNTTCRFELNGAIDETCLVMGRFSTSPILLADVSHSIRRYSKSQLPLRGSADVDGSFQVQLQPFQFDLSGRLNLDHASYASNRIGSASLTWNANRDGLYIHHHSRDFLGGSAALTAHVQALDWTRAVVEGQVRDIPAQRLADFVGHPVKVTGLVDGGFALHSIESLESIQGDAWVSTRGVGIRGVSFQIGEGKLSIERGQATLVSRGQFSTGSYELGLSCRLIELHEFLKQADREPSKIPVLANAKVTDIPLQRMIVAAGLERELASLDGRGSLSFVRDGVNVRDGSLGRATLSAEAMSWQQTRLSEYVTAEVALGSDRISLKRFNGRVADGQISGKAELSNRRPWRGSFDFSATNVNLRRATAPFVGSQNAATGRGSVYIKGRIDSTIHGRLNANVDNARISGVAIRRARLPVDWSYAVDSNVARWKLRSGSIDAGDGRIYIDSTGSYSRTLTMNSAVRIEHVDSAKLMPGRPLDVGVIDGFCTLQARRTNDPNRMTGTFDIGLSQIEVLRMPILDQLPQIISVPSIGFDWEGEQGGYFHGRLGGGMIRVEQLAVAQNNVQVLMDGTATLDGRLDLDVSVSTSDKGPIDELLSWLDSPVMSAGAAPVAMVVRANEALKHRVVHANIVGTAHRPKIHLNPGKQLSQDAIRFFIQSAAGSQVYEAATSARQLPRNRR